MVYTGDELNTDEALTIVTNLRNGTALKDFADGCVLQENLTDMSHQLYNRTCSYLDTMLPRDDLHHPLYFHVFDLRIGNRALLEYNVIYATTRFSEEKHYNAMENLYLALKTEKVVLHMLEIIENFEMIESIFNEKEGDFK